MKKQLILLFTSLLILSSCTTSKPVMRSEAYGTLYEETPLAIMVLPPINKSVNVEAKELFYSSLTLPLTQYGYYVLPSILTMDILKEESAYDTELYKTNSMKKVGEYFGADAVLITTIHEWNKTSLLNKIKVKVEYELRSTKTDDVLFHRTGDILLSSASNTGSILGNVIANMISTALTKEVSVGESCNWYTLCDIPYGKYSPRHLQDGEILTGPKEFSITVNSTGNFKGIYK